MDFDARPRGIENLSLIPGNCGTAPVQNIGAYGVELKDVFVNCEGVMVEDGSFFNIDKEAAQPAIAIVSSKNELKGKAIITRVTLELTKRNHRIRTDYGAISSELDKMGITEPTPKQISDVVVSIRQSKLPDPKEIGNSGSFFKNPVVSEEKAAALAERFPNMPSYPAEGGTKLAAGWIIDQCGWKGYRKDDAGVHKNQALVLVNYGQAKGDEIYTLAKAIMDDVYNRFGIQLEPG